LHGDVRSQSNSRPASWHARSSCAEKILTLLKAAGIRYVTLDLAGYRMGSLNEALAR